MCLSNLLNKELASLHNTKQSLKNKSFMSSRVSKILGGITFNFQKCVVPQMMFPRFNLLLSSMVASALVDKRSILYTYNKCMNPSTHEVP